MPNPEYVSPSPANRAPVEANANKGGSDKSRKQAKFKWVSPVAPTFKFWPDMPTRFKHQMSTDESASKPTFWSQIFRVMYSNQWGEDTTFPIHVTKYKDCL